MSLLDFAGYALFFAIWVILIRVFPSLLGTAVQKHIEHQYDRKLEQTKTELQASYSNLRTSVEFLSSTQSELRSKMIAAVEKLWGIILSVEKEFGVIMLIDKFWLPDYADKIFRTDEIIAPTMQEVKFFKDPNLPLEKLKEAKALNTEMERLFVGERLWLIYHTLIAVHSRFGYLIHESLNQKKYVKWQNEQSLISLFTPILSEEIINNAKDKKIGGLSMIVAYLKAEFLKESIRVMSGSQGFADSLSDINSTLQHETQKIRLGSAQEAS